MLGERERTAQLQGPAAQLSVSTQSKGFIFAFSLHPSRLTSPPSEHHTLTVLELQEQDVLSSKADVSSCFRVMCFTIQIVFSFCEFPLYF